MNESVSSENENDETIPNLPARGKNVTAITLSRPGSQGSAVVIAPSMSLIDDCANHMFESLRAAKQEDVYDIEAKCKIVKEIRELMRLKLDVMKHERE